jgi:two-component system OmpR family sensor kinase
VKSIERHLLAWLLGALSIFSVCLTVVLYALTVDELGEVLDEQLKQAAFTVLTHYDSGDQAPPPGAAPAKADLEGFTLVTQVWALDGRRLFSSMPELGIAFSPDEGYATVRTRDGRWRVYTDRSARYLIQAAQPLAAQHAMAAEIAFQFLAASVVAVALLAWLVMQALRRGLLPLVQTSHEIERRSAVSLEPIDAAALPSELHSLAGALNALMGKLSAALSAQRQFTADAAHELRTPLTALRLQVQVLLLAADEQARAEAAADIRRGLERATHLVEQLLSLSRVEPDAARAPYAPVDVAALVRAAVADFHAQAGARRIDLGADIAREVERDAAVQGDEEQLRVLLNNLVDNALRYTPSGGRVDVRLRPGPAPGSLRLEVADNGPGIAPAEHERVFDRFYRMAAGVDEQAAAPGSGLGLAIVRAIADRHGARIELARGLLSACGEPGLAVHVLLAVRPR